MYYLLNRIRKYSKPIAFIFLGASLLIPLLLLGSSLVFKNGEIASVGLIFLVFYTFSFIVNVPNWLFIFLVMNYKNKKGTKDYYFISIIFNLLMLGFFLFLYLTCEADYFCRTSDTPLGSAQGWYVGFLLGNFFWTLPYTFILSKIRPIPKKLVLIIIFIVLIVIIGEYIYWDIYRILNSTTTPYPSLFQ